MIRQGRYKYVHYVDAPPQLFDLQCDPQEVVDLAANSELATIREQMESTLRDLLDPLAVDAMAKQDQGDLIDRHGGRESVLSRGTFVNSPVPGEDPTYTAQQ